MWDHVDGFGRHLHQKVVSAKAFSRLSNKTKTQTYNKSPKIYLHQKVVSCLSKKQKQYINPKIQFFFFSKPFLPFQKRRKKKNNTILTRLLQPRLVLTPQKNKNTKKTLHLHQKLVSTKDFSYLSKKKYKNTFALEGYFSQGLSYP